jgi:hypothetical protein
MKVRLLFLASLGLLFISSSLGAADLADLAPPHTLAYMELNDPAALARELRTLVKGSYLQRPAMLFAQQIGEKDQKKNQEAYLFAWMCSTEFIDEFGDLQGGFAALTGFTRNDEPEVVGVLKTGKNRMIPLVFRFAMIEEGDFRCIARVEGIPIFQIGDAKKPEQPEIAKHWLRPVERLARRFHAPRKASLYQVALLENAPVEEMEEKPEFGCFVAILPNAIAFGTTPGILSDTVRRLRGNNSAPSLLAQPDFRAAAKGKLPGLFSWCDAGRLTKRINAILDRQLQHSQDAIRRQHYAKGGKRNTPQLKEELRQAAIDHRREIAEWTFLQKVLNPAEMRYASGCFASVESGRTLRSG